MDKTECYMPTGELQGDSRPMPNRGTGTGMNGDTYGADLSQSATNRTVGIKGSTKSDPHGMDMPHHNATIGSGS